MWPLMDMTESASLFVSPTAILTTVFIEYFKYKIELLCFIKMFYWVYYFFKMDEALNVLIKFITSID